MATISVVGNLELTGVRRNRVGLSPEFLSLLGVVLKHIVARDVLGDIQGRCTEVGSLNLGVVEDLVNQQLTVDGHRDGLTTESALRVGSEVLLPLRNGEGVEGCDGLLGVRVREVVAEGCEGGRRETWADDVEVAGLHVGVCGFQAGVQLEGDASVLSRVLTVVIVVLNEVDLDVVLPSVITG